MKSNKKRRVRLRWVKGVAAVEYALIAALIALAIIAGVKFLGDAIKNKLEQAATAIEQSTD